MEDYLGTETIIHGRQWEIWHGGYFSDPRIAEPLVETVRGILLKSPADLVVDLGGGTGFLLSQLRSRGGGADATLVNVDCSEAQLALSDEQDISSARTSIGSFKRRDVAPGDNRVCFMMRSALHYFGEDGLSPLLRYLRDQAKTGEYFVHQTASFDNEREAACLNALYRLMRTHKWYPTADDLRHRLTDAGWRVTETTPAPSLLLTSHDLGRRYALDADDIARIRDLLAREFGEMDGVFRILPSGFQAKLHYRIYTCVAAEKSGRSREKRNIQ